MKWITVNTPADWKHFHQVARHVYRNDPNWIEPLHRDVEAVFDPASNKAMKEGKANLLVALDEKGRAVGRVAAFIDPERNAEIGLEIGGIGFFECPDDPALANELLDRAETFLAKHHVQVIDGFINFGERDKFWGLLTTGFFPPLYQENYNPPYYRQFLEKRNYLPQEQILTFKGDMKDVPGQRLHVIAKRACQRYNFSTQSLAESDLPTMASRFAHVYNVAFAEKPHFKPISEKQMIQLFSQLRPIADRQMVTVALQGDRPIGIAGFIPDINPFLRSAKGRLTTWSLPGFFLRLKTSQKKLLKGIAFGIDPEFHGKGVFAVLTDSIYRQKNLSHYPYYYLAAIRAHNDLMVRSVQALGVKVDRVHWSFRKYLDPKVKIEAHPFINQD